MKTKITAISKIKKVTRKDRNSLGEWEENVFEYKYIETLPYISFTRRLFHRLVDIVMMHLFFIIIYFSFGFIIGLLSEISKLVILENNISYFIIGATFILSYFFTSFFYYVLFESLFGRTIGHLLSGAIVLNEYGEKPTFKNIIIRAISRYMPLNSISAFEHRAWHDLWSNTLVVHKKSYEKFMLNLDLEGVLKDENNHIETAVF